MDYALSDPEKYLLKYMLENDRYKEFDGRVIINRRFKLNQKQVASYILNLTKFQLVNGNPKVAFISLSDLGRNYVLDNPEIFDTITLEDSEEVLKESLAKQSDKNNNGLIRHALSKYEKDYLLKDQGYTFQGLIWFTGLNEGD